jgi:PKD repeat protein
MTSLQFRVVSLWLRARAGGQFLLAWHDKLCDINGWDCNWEPFVYNGIGYNNGYDFWHPNPPQDRSNAPVKPDVWYTLKLKVHETPFQVTGEVYAESGTLLGSLTIDAMNDLTFKDIKYVYMSTGAGGTFYVRNISIADIPPLENVHAEPVGGWQVAGTGGQASESNGTITLSGDYRAAGLTLWREFLPKNDFEISLQVKAATLGEVHRDPAGGGEGFAIMLRPNASLFGTAIGVNFELRARGGGQFLLTRHNNNCDLYGWACDWTPFLYNSLEYNNGYSYWHPNPPQDRSNAPIKPNVWYTMKLKIQENPFTVTTEVLDENGTLLGSYSTSDMNNFAFKDIKVIGISSGFGGTFYVRNITGIAPDSDFVFAPEEAVVDRPVAFNASENANSYRQALNYTWEFGDGNTTVTQQQAVTHAYASPGTFNVTLTVTDSMGEHSSSVHSIRARAPTYLSISTESSFSMVGSIVNVNGKLLDASGVGLANEPLVLQYTFPGTTSWFPISSGFTNAAGDYSIQWINPATGSFTLKAEWAGNGTHVGAGNTTTLSSLPYQNLNVFFVESNSTVSSLAFNSTSSELSFIVSGASGTTGYVKATIAKTLISNAENLKVYLDGNQLTYSLTETANSWLLAFNYSHSTHRVNVYLPTSLPIETPSTTYTTPRASALPASNTDSEGVNFEPWIAIIGIAALTLTIGTLVFQRRKLS